MRGDCFVLCVACNRRLSLPRAALPVEGECGMEYQVPAPDSKERVGFKSRDTAARV